MDPPEFTGSNITKDTENFMEELHKVVELMRIDDAKRVELASYQLKGVARISYGQWKKKRAEGAPLLSCVILENAFLGSFFLCDLKDAKVRDFLNIKQESMSVHEYSPKFTQLSYYSLEMVAAIKSRMSLFVFGLCRLSSKEGKKAMLIGDMDIGRLMIHVQQFEEDKMKDRGLRQQV
ncbi:hypothetical protein MTR67_026777 [Solanum verrucosum]|uniref:Retrotransposon gag domain-containing protein n=1 Tax=Solanum verrucosum TaxID=315347 RepID=A0AAF0R3S7_SOLVR|nr:hypothetical protein MTR67_026777 [Solanum verrucosum]